MIFEDADTGTCAHCTHSTSVADPDPGSGAFLPGSGIRIRNGTMVGSGSGIRLTKFVNSLCKKKRSDPGSGIRCFFTPRIRDKNIPDPQHCVRVMYFECFYILLKRFKSGFGCESIISSYGPGSSSYGSGSCKKFRILAYPQHSLVILQSMTFLKLVTCSVCGREYFVRCWRNCP
jgi:hypothetical protein